MKPLNFKPPSEIRAAINRAWQTVCPQPEHGGDASDGAWDCWIIGLLDGWIIGWLDYWMVGLLDGWIAGWLDCWMVGLLDCCAA